MKKSWKEKNKELAAFWKSHIEQWSQTNMTQIDYCRQHDISHNRFTYWKLKFNQSLPVKFVQVVPEPMNLKSLPGLRLNIDPGLQIEIPDGFSRRTLEQILQTLKVL
ncbi:IS66 family insertion sequence element accessory protein TnpB [Thermodesulfobacteriota bacterium]